jgi:capsular exopolysaccharide synthesis family protein
MSKIFDALRKAERDSGMIALTPEAQVEPAATLQPRHVRLFETEFGYLANSIQSCFASSSHGRIILVVGCAQREGCTYVASNLARVLARSVGTPILYIDGNFHDPSLHKEFAARNELGLSDAYSNGRPRDLASIVQPSDTDQLYLLGTGTQRISPAAFFGGAQFTGILTSVRRAFGYTVIDAPPLMKYPDSIHLAQRVDGVVMVVRHKRLKRQVIRKGLELIESVNAPVLGVVLNRRKFSIPDLIYKMVS